MKALMRRRLIGSIMVALLVAAGSVVTAAPANAVVVGVCTIKANNPHPSTHVNGTINAMGTVTCTVTMDEIYIKAVLERADGATWNGTTANRYFTSNEQANASTLCSNELGYLFRLRVSYVLRAPAGYTPAYSSNTIYSPWVGAKCGAAQFADPGDELLHNELTHTVELKAMAS